ncbi:MAG: class I SAM-dependent methyltransferase [Rhodospirillales bacterium]|nr:class I SAM-dependent methyltransferase [Rhodospirillales bacterium]
MDDAANRRAEWHRYYSEKRIGQQWMQVNLLAGLDITSVLEVGPYLGLVTAMLDNAGYDVTTLDLFAPPFERPRRPSIEADLTSVTADLTSGFDAIICCETLEHLSWDDALPILRTFHESGAYHLVLSVPYEGFQLGWSLYLNPFTWRHAFSLKKLRSRKAFKVHDDPWGHKWELGYKGYTIERWEALIREAGWTIQQRTFTHPCRSVFHLCER